MKKGQLIFYVMIAIALIISAISTIMKRPLPVWFVYTVVPLLFGSFLLRMFSVGAKKGFLKWLDTNVKQ